MEPIRITPISEKVVEKKPLWPSGYEIISEQIGIDQHGHRWHSFHKRMVSNDDPIQVGDAVPLSTY